MASATCDKISYTTAFQIEVVKSSDDIAEPKLAIIKACHKHMLIRFTRDSLQTIEFQQMDKLTRTKNVIEVKMSTGLKYQITFGMPTDALQFVQECLNRKFIQIIFAPKFILATKFYFTSNLEINVNGEGGSSCPKSESTVN